ncbi:MAG TPA: DUF4232 domain-containing protein [Jatrophihabitans sp.]|jgi:hypothetical protein
MTPDELDTAIRDELRTEARRAPAAAPVKAQVLLATRSMDDGQPRGLRAWLVPMLAAAAVLVVTLGVTAGPKLLRSDGPDRTPPAVSSTSAAPAPSASATSPTPSTAPARPTPTASTTASHSPSSAVPQGWYRKLDFNALPHTPGLCPQSGSRVGMAGYLPVARPVSVPGEPAPLWLLPVTCTTTTTPAPPAPVEVFRYSPKGPQLVQTLAYEPGNHRALMVNSIRVGADHTLHLTEWAYAPTDPPCCRSLRFSQDYTWSAAQSRFLAGPQVDALLPCTIDQLMVDTVELKPSPNGDARGILQKYVNKGAEPCTMYGYPGAAIVDAAGHPLAEAARTPGGFYGGLASGEPTRIVLYISITSSAVIEWTPTQHGNWRCYEGATLLITPPGSTTPMSVGAKGQVCGLQVHPVVRGDTGRTVR